MADYYTKQYCEICKEEVKIDALDFLMNLDSPVVCDKCKELNKKQNAIFNNFMEENYPIAYKLNQMSYEIKKK